MLDMFLLLVVVFPLLGGLCVGVLYAVFYMLRYLLDNFLSSIKENQRMKNKDDKIKRAINSGTDVNAIDDGEFLNLCRNGTLEKIKYAINSGANINAFGKKNGKSALMYAVERNKPDMITLLLEAGADVNAINKDGKPTLMYAVEHKNPKVISLLLEAGADVNAVNKEGKSALINAVERKDTKVISLLLKAGADVNAVDKEGKSALIYAIEKLFYPVISLLIDAGADVNAADRDGLSALMFVAEAVTDNPDLISLLLDVGADVNAVDKNGESALMKANFRYNKKNDIWLNYPEEVISLLLEAGADVTSVNKNGKSFLMKAVSVYNINPYEIIRLLDEGANVNAVDSDGWSPLMYAACYCGNPNVLIVLIEAGADITLRNNNYDTAADIARKRERNKGEEIFGEKILQMLDVPIASTTSSKTAISSSPSAPVIDVAVDNQVNEEYIQVMKTLVTKFGQDIYLDSKRFGGLIMDYFASDKKMKKILLLAVHDGTAAEIHALRDAEQGNLQYEISRIAKKFIDENALVESTGREVINCLIEGLLDISE